MMSAHQEIINSHAELGKMLFKSYAQLYEAPARLRRRQRDAKRLVREVVGCVGLTIIWADLAEIRSLAVDDAYRGRGVGRQLVSGRSKKRAVCRIRRIMSLTYEQPSSRSWASKSCDKDTLPLKVWSDCVRCPKRDGCDEIAMVKTLADVPMIVMPTAVPTPRGVSIPVLGNIED